MEKEVFNLQPTDDFIELNKLLKLMGIAQTGGHAKLLIDEEEKIESWGYCCIRKRLY